MVSHLVDLLLIAIASQEHKQALSASFERLRSPEPVTRPAGSTTVEAEAAPEPWRIYEEWEVEAPAALLSCREQAPPVSRRGEVEIRLVVDAFGVPTLPSVDPGSGLYLSMSDEDDLEEWVRRECRFVAAEKLGRPVQSRFTLTVRYR